MGLTAFLRGHRGIESDSQGMIGDIDWNGVYIKDHKESPWFAGGEKMYLREVRLRNGLLYVIPVVQSTGQTFDTVEEIDPEVPPYALNIHLTNNWRVTELGVRLNPNHRHPTCSAQISKIYEAGNVRHDVSYAIDPFSSFLNFTYGYKSPFKSVQINMATTNTGPVETTIELENNSNFPNLHTGFHIKYDGRGVMIALNVLDPNRLFELGKYIYNRSHNGWIELNRSEFSVIAEQAPKLFDDHSRPRGLLKADTLRCLVTNIESRPENPIAALTVE